MLLLGSTVGKNPNFSTILVVLIMYAIRREGSRFTPAPKLLMEMCDFDSNNSLLLIQIIKKKKKKPTHF